MSEVSLYCLFVSARRQRSHDDLEALLAEQLEYLRLSCASFDGGCEAEAKRLTAPLRVLLHDGKGCSRSLLGQLGLKGVPFWDSAPPDVPGNLLSYSGLVGMSLSTQDGAKYYAPLDNRIPGGGRWISFDAWWNAIVFRDNAGNSLSRKELVLTVAEQDGGVHVDAALNENYAKFTQDNALGWMFSSSSGGQGALEGAERAALRQIAHEVLKSVAPKVSRNDPCWCGSGMKFKKCHGA